MLAEGTLAIGQPGRAGTILADAARRAAAAGEAASAVRFWFAAASAWFQAGVFDGCQHACDAVEADSGAGTLRPKAALLRALARGRARREAAEPVSQQAYTSALVHVTTAYPEAPEASEARWLLAHVRGVQGDHAQASALLLGVAPGHPRRALALRTWAAIRREALEDALRVRSVETVSADLARVRDTLDGLANEAASGEESRSIVLARAEIEATPVIGSPERVLRLVEGAEWDSPGQRDAFRLIALLGLGRQGEADVLARSLAARESPNVLLDLALRLDEQARLAQGDLPRRRAGELVQRLSEQILTRDLGDAHVVARARLLMARGRAFAGHRDHDLRTLPQRAALGPAEPEWLGRWAEQMLAAGSPGESLEAYRSLAAEAPEGSDQWIDARLGMAECLRAMDQRGRAESVLAATRLLLPEGTVAALGRRYRDLERSLGAAP